MKPSELRQRSIVGIVAAAGICRLTERQGFPEQRVRDGLEEIIGEVIVYETPSGGVRVEVRLDRDTVKETR